MTARSAATQNSNSSFTCARILLLLATLLTSAASPVKLTTWNLNWLTLRHTGDPALPDDVHTRTDADFAQLRHYAEHLDADIIAFEEVDGEQAAARVFDPANYTILTINEDVVQRVGVAVRRGWPVVRHPDVTSLDVEPYAVHRLRDGLDVTITVPGGAQLRLLAVHLKTGCHEDDLRHARRAACALLAEQIPPLAAWVAARREEGVAFAVLGDFNRVLDRPDPLEQALGPDLLRATQGLADPCWGGGSFIDHIVLGGPARAWIVPGSLRVMTYRTTDPADRERLSDHCPVSIRLQPAN